MKGSASGGDDKVVGHGIGQPIEVFFPHIAPSCSSLCCQCLLDEIGPETLSEPAWSQGRYPLLGMEGGYLRERRTNIVDRQPGPVDGNRSFIFHIVQETGGIAGETEDGRSAQSPVGDIISFTLTARKKPAAPPPIIAVLIGICHKVSFFMPIRVNFASQRQS